MKRTIQAALVVAALLNGTYALADDPAKGILRSGQVTYADMQTEWQPTPGRETP